MLETIGVGRCVPTCSRARRVAVVKDQRIAVLILEKCLMTDAAVHDLAAELDTTRLEVCTGSRDVIDVQRDRPFAGRELAPDLRGVDYLDRQAAGLELAAEVVLVTRRAR